MLRSVFVTYVGEVYIGVLLIILRKGVCLELVRCSVSTNILYITSNAKDKLGLTILGQSTIKIIHSLRRMELRAVFIGNDSWRNFTCPKCS